MTQDYQQTLRLESEQRKRWQAVWRATFPKHGLSFNAWLLAMVERGIEGAK